MFNFLSGVLGSSGSSGSSGSGGFGGLGGLFGGSSSSSGGFGGFLSKIGKPNFQSGFGSLNDIADSIGSIFGFGPEDRASVLSRSTSTHITPMNAYVKRELAQMNEHNAAQILTKLDRYLSFYIKQAKSGSYKSANMRAAQANEVSGLTSILTNLRSKASSSFDTTSKYESVREKTFENKTFTQQVTYNQYRLKSSVVAKINDFKNPKKNDSNSAVGNSLGVAQGGGNVAQPLVKKDNTMMYIAALFGVLILTKKIKI